MLMVAGCLLFALPARSQEITRAEYFLNEDPGHGAGIAIPVQPGQSEVELAFDIESALAGLDPGLHKLYVRVQDSRGSWSLLTERNILVAPPQEAPKLVQFEYLYRKSDQSLVSRHFYNIPAELHSDTVEMDFQADVTNLVEGEQYRMFVWAIDANGSGSLYAITDLFTFAEQPPIVITLSSANVSCNGANDGTITASAEGEGTLEYSLDNQNFGADTVFTGLAAGDYTVYVRSTDAPEYVEQAEVTITEPSALLLSAGSTTQPSCPGEATGSVALSASGGTGSYQFSQNGSDFQSGSAYNFSFLPEGTFNFSTPDQVLPGSGTWVLNNAGTELRLDGGAIIIRIISISETAMVLEFTTTNYKLDSVVYRVELVRV